MPSMPLMSRRSAAMMGLVSLVAGPAMAQAWLDGPKPVRFVTRHTTRIQGRTIAYTATAGETILRDLQGKPTASLFSFAYVKDGEKDPARPVTFVFNGGPGSSSIWLHLGVMGPRRVVLDADVNPSVVPPFALEDNPDCPLDVTDLIFIDPVGTGFSKALGDTKPEAFFGVDEDAGSVAQFIELWLSQNGRWNSPKYVMGESYGSMRAALMPRALMGGPGYMGVMRGVTLNGIILLGTTLGARPGERSSPDLVAALSLPCIADTAWHHNRIDRAGRSLEAFDAEVKAFAMSDYLSALAKASVGVLGPAERDATAQRLAAYTGLPASELLKDDLRVQTRSFAKRLLADKGLELGLYDSRYTLPLGGGGDAVADDPAMAQYVPPFIGAFQDLLRKDLKVTIDAPYGAIVWKDLNPRWNWKRAGVPEGQTFAVDLAVGMRRDPALKVMVASGYYDLVTTAASAEYDLRQASIPKDRITFKTYESGHMLYLGGTAPAFARDVRAFVRPTT